MFRQCCWGMTNSILLNTMVTLINMYLVYFYDQKQFQTKIDIKITFIIISIYVSLGKSFVNGSIGKNIVICDPLEAEEIKIMPLSMYIWCAVDRFCGIYEKVDFPLKIHVFINMNVLLRLQCSMMVGLSPCACLC